MGQLFLNCLAICLSVSAVAAEIEVIPDKDWVTANDVISFQPFAETTGPLINLNNHINQSFILHLTDNKTLNLENPAPGTQRLSINKDGKLTVKTKSGEQVCDDIYSLPKQRDPYTAVCNGLLYLRNHSDGRKESVTWSSLDPASAFPTAQFQANSAGESIAPPDAPFENAKELKNTGNGFKVSGAKAGMLEGRWYATDHFPGVFVSAVDPGNMVNLVAMDLSQFRFGWVNGTEHPGVGWSSRAKRSGGAGPDGFNTLEPLVFPAVVPPQDLSKTVGLFAGGFQRHHSAFRQGPYHDNNRGSHYGFMENGVLMSTLVPNLATFIVYADGTIDIKTWTLADNDKLDTMADIRQNGVPLVADGVVNPLVNNWGHGNWSGSADKQLKTPRMAACLIEKDKRRYLLISYFATHTPAQMADVLVSYQCKYAIHLDMNSAQYAYTAFFSPRGDGSFATEHLSTAMDFADTMVNGKPAPRYLLTPTYRDFFYIMKR